jgi:hypothetical protein
MPLKPTQLHFCCPERSHRDKHLFHFGFHNSSLLLQSKIVSEHTILLKNFVDQQFQLHNLG